LQRVPLAVLTVDMVAAISQDSKPLKTISYWANSFLVVLLHFGRRAAILSKINNIILENYPAGEDASLL